MKVFEPDMRELLDVFLSEAWEFMDSVDEHLSSLGKGDDPERINTIFRAYHSLKGSSGMVHLTNVSRLTHSLETLLELFRKSGTSPDADTVDTLYSTNDFIRELLKKASKDMSDAGMESETDVYIRRIDGTVDTLKREPNGSASETASAGRGVSGDEDAGAGFFRENDMKKVFAAEALGIVKTCLDRLSGIGEAGGLRDETDSLVHALETVRRNAALVRAVGIEKSASSILNIAADMRKDASPVESGFLSSVKKELADLVSRLSELSTTGSVAGEPDAGSAGGTQAEYHERKIGEILVDLGEVSSEGVRTALEIQSGLKSAPAAAPKADLKRKDLRIETGKLDALLNLTGELITAEAMVRCHPDLEAVQSPALSRVVTYLSKITREIQETAMSMRMIPLDGLFTRMHRVVRDLAHRMGKDVELRITGADTEMDRTIIEEITDPLVHLVRNAIDHGIERKDARKASGKQETGKIDLSARYEGNEIWISVRDDGGGISRSAVRKKALELGMLQDGDRDVPDQDLLALIFEPGFSTSGTVTDVSGRGVGMDVVRRNIEKLRGRVQLESVEGKYTQVTMRIPLTLAVVSATLIRVGNQVYAVPIYSSREFLKAAAEKVFVVENRECIRVREDVIPIVDLHRFFGKGGGGSRVNEGIIIIVDEGGRKAGLLADSIEGYQQIVIKSLTEYIGEPAGVSGCSILGNGEVCFILDAGGIIEAELEK